MTMIESKELLNIEQDMPKKKIVLKDLASKPHLLLLSITCHHFTFP